MPITYYTVKVHSCRIKNEVLPISALKSEQRYVTIDESGLWFRQMSLRCRCREWTTFHDADDLVDSGKAVRIHKIKKGALKADDLQIWKPVVREKVPRIDLITRPDIERAYIDENKEYIQYIEDVHEMAMEFRASLIVPFQPDPFEGRLLFPFSSDKRTAGGHAI